MRTPRSSVAALVAALSLPLLALAAGCGSSDDARPAEPTFNADLNAQFAGPQGCVPNPRPAPTGGVPVLSGESWRDQRVVIEPDRSWQRAHGASSDEVIAAIATLTSATVESAIRPSSPGAPADPRVPGLTPDHRGDRFVIVRYRLRNHGRYMTSSGQISGHLLVGAGGRWFAPVVGCRFDNGEAAQQVQDVVAGQTDARASEVVAPGASATTLAVYVVPGDAGHLRWASSPDYARATPLTPAAAVAR